MGFDISYGAAAFAGLLSFLSPCILPIVPFYLCYIAGVSFSALTPDGKIDPHIRTRVVLTSILFSLGVITIFVGLGAVATSFGQQLREWFDSLRYVAAGIILLLGLHFLGVLRIGLLYREARFDLGEQKLGYLGAYLIGLAFAFGWTPCVGPVLATILFTASAADTAADGALLLLVYALGMTLPFVLAALFAGPFLSWTQGFRKHLKTVEQVMGSLLIAFSVLIGTNSVNIIAEWMLKIAPNIGTLQ
ncbi:MAG: cytochrome c biogenesis protein CcdA [Rhodobacteraceae bacterium]|nr:cytochrome c biogenesis protein CcdA [Paracoccaceae bacterium]